MMCTDTYEQHQSQSGLLARLRQRTQEIIGDLRQWQYPVELRIVRPMPRKANPTLDPAVDMAPESSTEDTTRLDRAIAKVAVCLWDIRRKLKDNQAVQQDRKLRLLNRRSESAIMALHEMGVVIDDPVGRRYVLGSEGSMKPHLLPIPGATADQIVETVAPIVYRDDRLIGRGEVFVAVPAPSERQDAIAGIESSTRVTGYDAGKERLETNGHVAASEGTSITPVASNGESFSSQPLDEIPPANDEINVPNQINKIDKDS